MARGSTEMRNHFKYCSVVYVVERGFHKPREWMRTPPEQPIYVHEGEQQIPLILNQMKARAALVVDTTFQTKSSNGLGVVGSCVGDTNTDRKVETGPPIFLYAHLAEN